MKAFSFLIKRRNDDNNFIGRAGSPLTFQVRDGASDELLWVSEPVQSTGVVQKLQLDLPEGTSRLKLQVTAANSNACAHAVWVDPQLTT